MNKPKLIRLTTIPMSLNILLRGQLYFLSKYFNLIAVSSEGNDLIEVAEREQVPVKAINIEREISPIKDVISLRKLISFFKKEKPDIVHINTPKASLLGMIAAYLCKVPIRIYTVTGLRFQGFKAGSKQKLLISMERLTCRLATHVVPEGQGVKATLQEYKITTKPLQPIANGNINGVDLSYFNPEDISAETRRTLRQELGIRDSDFIYCFVGRLVIDKGITELVAAFQLQKMGSKLLLVGAREELGNALSSETLFQMAQNSNIIEVGFQQDVRPYLALADVFVFPSYREGFPNVVLQAGAMGLPCIVTDINGSNEIIVQGYNGTIVPTKNTAALSEAMAQLYTNDILRSRMISIARLSIAERFDQQVVWAALLERYNQYLCSQ